MFKVQGLVHWILKEEKPKSINIFTFHDSTEPEDKIDGVAWDAAEDDHLQGDRQGEVEGIVCPVNLALGLSNCFAFTLQHIS